MTIRGKFLILGEFFKDKGKRKIKNYSFMGNVIPTLILNILKDFCLFMGDFI